MEEQDDEGMQIEFVTPDEHAEMRIDFDVSERDEKAGVKDEIVVSQEEITGELSPI